jgi:glucan 1,3-beta-glucosidase
MAKRLLLALALLLAFVHAGVAGELSWLRAKGNVIVDEGGRRVVLRGVNLGGWLVEEMWMMPFETTPPPGSRFGEVTDHVTLWATIEKRFGPAETARVRTALRNAWLDEADIRRIRAAGLDSVRVPFLYDLIDEPDGFSWLDRLIGWAGRHGLYVVLDLHGAPGRQSSADHTGEAGVNRLFDDDAMVARAKEVWRRVARRYKDRPEVAAYDLLNEPMGAESNARLYEVQERLYRAIRAVDARHIVIIEDGFKGVRHMPAPRAMGWRNVVYSAHSYDFEAKCERDHYRHRKWFVSEIRAKQHQSPVPFYVGEFNHEPHGVPATVASFTKLMERRGWSWALWTYKVVKKDGGGPKSLWGWFRNTTRFAEPLDPFRDSADELVRKTERLRTGRLEEHEALGRVLRGDGASRRRKARR